MHIPRAICGQCGREMQIEQTGIAVEMKAHWGPYYKIYGDKYVCVNGDCTGSEVVLLAKQAVAEHFEETYADYPAHMQGSFLA